MNLTAQLEQLDAQQIIRRANEPDLAYLFKHAMTQETAYASLLKKARRDIHLQVAQTIEVQCADQLDDYAALLAQHYAAGEDDAKTREYATRAGEVSARIFANAEAVAHYSMAIDAARRLAAPTRDLFLKRGRALELIGKYPDALASYVEMESLAHERGDGALELGSLVARATLFSTHTPLYDPSRAQKFSADALELARKIGDRLTEAKILWTQMLRYTYGSVNSQAGVENGEASLKILRELSTGSETANDRTVREQLAYTLNDLFYAYIQLGKLERGLATRTEARDLWRELDNKPMLADNLAGMSIAQWSFGQAQSALAIADEAFAVAESANNPWSMAQGRTMRGYALAELGEFAKAFAALREGDQYATAVETGGAMLAARCGLATLYLTLGSIERGLEWARRALAGAQKYIPDWHLWPHALLVRLHLARGDMATALRIADECGLGSPERKLFRAFMPGVAMVVLADAELALAKKDYARVAVIADSEIAYFKGSCLNYLPDLFLVRANAFLGQGKREPATQILREALTVISARRVRWQVLGTLTQFARTNGAAETTARWDAEARAEIEFIAQNLDDETRLGFLDSSLVKQVLKK